MVNVRMLTGGGLGGGAGGQVLKIYRHIHPASST